MLGDRAPFGCGYVAPAFRRAAFSSLFIPLLKGAIMSTSTSTPATGASKKTVGYIVQLAGLASFTLGAIFSVHHVAIGAAFLGGAAAFYVGQKIRTLS
ncbi:MAG: hypothetical protein ABR973_05030 [Candidatus Acidiferrales bacterium]|jgi:hypothetical protein